MCKSLITISAALAIVSLGSLTAAQAGNGAQGISKNSNHYQTRSANYRITEFSSSSTKGTAAHR